MATTYGYGGEFSSDEDIERMEQQSDRLVQSKSDAYAALKPSRDEIEETIEIIRQLPLDQDVPMPDGLLAALLDHYKTQRGPIVDSTRNLYKKIILRLIRQDQQQPVSNGDDKESNGNNNNDINILNKRQQPVTREHSSDEDEPMPPAPSQGSGDPARGRIEAHNDLEPMDVDVENRPLPMEGMRSHKPYTHSSSESETTEESDTTDSEVLDVTPVKLPGHNMHKIMHSSTPKAAEVNKKTPPVVPKPKEVIDTKKKPYTRSQRVAASRTSSTKAGSRSDVSSSKVDSDLPDEVKISSQRASSSKSKVKYFIFALIVLVIALLTYGGLRFSKIQF